jgi:hypothetical protein
LLEQARFFQKYQPAADFDTPWQSRDLFVYRLKGGGQARFRRDQGVAFEAHLPGQPPKVLEWRIEGVSEATLPGSIPGWLAFDAEKIIGLNPNRATVVRHRGLPPRTCRRCWRLHVESRCAGGICEVPNILPGEAKHHKVLGLHRVCYRRVRWGGARCGRSAVWNLLTKKPREERTRMAMAFIHPRKGVKRALRAAKTSPS